MEKIMKYVFILCCLALSGCATMQWGEFDGQRLKKADPDVYDVIVVAIDGMARFDGRTIERLKPGFHLLQVASTRKGQHSEISTMSLPISVKPCTRYSFVAKYHQRVSIQNWELVATGETLMAGCEVQPPK